MILCVSSTIFCMYSAFRLATLSFELRLPGPTDVPVSPELFRCYTDDLLNRWDSVTLLRTLPIERGSVACSLPWQRANRFFIAMVAVFVWCRSDKDSYHH